MKEYSVKLKIRIDQSTVLTSIYKIKKEATLKVPPIRDIF